MLHLSSESSYLSCKLISPLCIPPRLTPNYQQYERAERTSTQHMAHAAAAAGALRVPPRHTVGIGSTRPVGLTIVRTMSSTLRICLTIAWCNLPHAINLRGRQRRNDNSDYTIGSYSISDIEAVIHIIVFVFQCHPSDVSWGHSYRQPIFPTWYGLG